MSQQSKTGDIGACADTEILQTLGGRLVRQQHGLDGGIDPAPFRPPAHVRREQRACADRFGQDQCVTGPQTALAQHPVRRDESIHGQTEGQFGAFAGVPAGQHRPAFRNHLQGPAHHVVKGLLHDPLAPVGHGCNRQDRLRLGPHGEQVPQRMIGRDLTEHIGVIDEGAEIVDALCQQHALGHAIDRCVIRRIQADHDIVATLWRQPLDHPTEHTAANLGTAAAAAHGQGGQLLDRLLIRHPVGEHGTAVGDHVGQFVEPLHEAPVDPVLQAPQPCALDRPAAARCNRVTVSGADQAKKIALRPVGLQRSPTARAAQILGQHRSLTHRKHTRLGARIGHRGDIACGKHLGMRARLQVPVDLDKTGLIHGQAGPGRPVRCRRLGHPEHGIGLPRGLTLRVHRVGADLHHPMSGMQGDTAFAQDACEASPHPGIVAAEDLVAVGQDLVVQALGIVTLAGQQRAQTVLGRQRQFDTAGATADHHHPEGPAACKHPLL